jgi:hypothetical protein
VQATCPLLAACLIFGPSETRGIEMAARLGHVLHVFFGWIAAGLLLWWGVTVFKTVTPEHRDVFAYAFTFGPAAVSWLFGRTCLYVLSGE